jgi:hypothetical protein
VASKELLVHKVLTHKKTGAEITVTKLLDGQKNTVIIVSGFIDCKVDEAVFSVIEAEALTGAPKMLRWDGLVYLLGFGLSCVMSYKDLPYKIPLEGKGKLDLDPFGGVPVSDPLLTFKGKGAVFIVFDISK